MPNFEAHREDPIDVVIVEDHPAFRYALEQVIARHPRLRLAGSYPDGTTAFAARRNGYPLVALVDVELPGCDGITVLRRLTTEVGARALVISAHTDGVVVRDALASGATGYLTKSADLSEIEAAVIATAEGRSVLCPVAQQALAQRLRLDAASDSALTDRETQVLGLAANGHTRAAIGRRLYLSEATVKAHLAATYRKLGVSSRPAAIVEAQRRGLISDRRHAIAG